MKEYHNPYKTALDGLLIEDPVKSFFDFCKERESIRKKRELGQSPPWSSDPIFQKGRFLNVFREHDRGSVSIIRFARNLKDELPKLIHALFFCRWVNRQQTIDMLTSSDLSKFEELVKKLNALQVWCNKTAYPVESIQWEGKTYQRFEAASELFYNIQAQLTKIIISSERCVVKATKNVNEKFKMKNDFPIFMAIMDIAWFRPDIINPGSNVPTGIGAVAYLNRLQNHLGLSNHKETFDRMIALQNSYWPEAERIFYPIDIEYISCECRKYFSYVNGTKSFKDKNLFIPNVNF